MANLGYHDIKQARYFTNPENPIKARDSNPAVINDIGKPVIQ